MPLNTKMIFADGPYTSLDQDEGLPPGTPSKSKSPNHFPKLYRLEVVLAAALLGAAASGLLVLLALNPSGARGSQDLKAFTPDLPFSSPRVFEMHDDFVNGVGTASWTKTWYDKMMPTDGGFVSIPNPQQYGLSGGFPLSNATTPTEAYSLSIFHQLHCLMALRQDTLDLLNQTAFHPANVDLAHNNHCYEYIRQAILCAGDMTLEPAEVEGGKRAHSVDGWGVVHQCRNFDSVFEFAEKHGDGSSEWLRAEDIGGTKHRFLGAVKCPPGEGKGKLCDGP